MELRTNTNLKESISMPSPTKTGSASNSEISAVTLGILSDPPTLVLIYDVEESGQHKRRKRKMPLRSFSDRSSVPRAIFGLKQRHEKFLQTIPPVTLEKMIRIIQEILKGMPVEEAVVKVHQEYEINPNEDLNKLSTIDLSQKKEIMQEAFVKHQVKPDDPNYVYDKEIDFPEPKGKENPWDSDEDESASIQKINEIPIVAVPNDLSKSEPEGEPDLKSDDSDNDNGEDLDFVNLPLEDESSTVKVNVNAKATSAEAISAEKVEPKVSDLIYGDIDDEDFW